MPSKLGVMDKRQEFEKEVDNSVKFLRLGHRPRCKEWIEFSQRFVDRYERWNGCWVADMAVKEWLLYLQLPEGEYEPEEYPEGWDFRRSPSEV